MQHQQRKRTYNKPVTYEWRYKGPIGAAAEQNTVPKQSLQQKSKQEDPKQKRIIAECELRPSNLEQRLESSRPNGTKTHQSEEERGNNVMQHSEGRTSISPAFNLQNFPELRATPAKHGSEPSKRGHSENKFILLDRGRDPNLTL